MVRDGCVSGFAVTKLMLESQSTHRWNEFFLSYFPVDDYENRYNPNAGHITLAALQRSFPDSVKIITQVCRTRHDSGPTLIFSKVLLVFFLVCFASYSHFELRIVFVRTSTDCSIRRLIKKSEMRRRLRS